jgi:membrane protein
VKLVDRVRRRVEALRGRWSLLDHLIAAVQHYLNVRGNLLAGAITYYGYLSVFPVLVLAFALLGGLTYGNLRATTVVTDAVNRVLPGLIGAGEGQLSMATVHDAAGTVGVISVLTLLYTGLGWLSALRQALLNVFQLPPETGRTFFAGKAVDLMTFAVLAVVLLVSIGLSAAVTGLTGASLHWLLLDNVPGTNLLVRAVALVLGVTSSTGLFLVMFRLLPKLDLPVPALVRGALLAAVGFEGLKLMATYLIRLAAQNPATALLGTSLVLLVWINLSSRIMVLGACWAVTTEQARRVLPRLRESLLHT